MRALALFVLALVFLDELLCMAAFAVVGWHATPSGLAWLLVWLLPLVAMLVWFFLCSPKARYGGPVLRPVAKLVVFGSACLGLAWAGHAGLASALLVFSAVVNGIAQLRFVREAQAEML